MAHSVIKNYQHNPGNDMINNFDPAALNAATNSVNQATKGPIQKVAIESLLAKISAVKNKKEKIDA
jgi:hypothetical protein